MLQEHQRTPQVCEIREQEKTKGIITHEQEKELRSKKRSRKLSSEEDKWKDVYRIIFPTDSVIPSPCKLRIPFKFFEILLNHQIDLEVETSGRFTRFQEFSERKTNDILKNQLKRAAEEDERFRDEELRRKILNMFRNAQSEVFVRFGQFQSESEPESNGQALESQSDPRETASLQEQHSPGQDSIVSTPNNHSINGQDSLPQIKESTLDQPPATQDNLRSEFPSLLLPLDEIPPHDSLKELSPGEERDDPSRVGDTTYQGSGQCFVQSEEEQLDWNAEFAGLFVEPSEPHGTSAEPSFSVEPDRLFDISSDFDWPFSFDPDCN